MNEVKIKKIMDHRADIDLAMKDLNMLEGIIKQLESMDTPELNSITIRNSSGREIIIQLYTYPNPLYSEKEVKENRETVKQLIDLFWAITHTRIKDRCESIQKMTT